MKSFDVFKAEIQVRIDEAKDWVKVNKEPLLIGAGMALVITIALCNLGG